jgi:biotin transport system substrate-specific component
MAQAAATLRQATFKRTGVLVDAAVIVGGALVVAAAAQLTIPLPFTPVPITGQTFAVLLVGASLGPWHGASSLMLYVLLGAVGLPFYAGQDHGWSILQGATGGYLLSYPIAAWATGALAARGWDRKIGSAIGAMLTGNVIIYLIGLPWLAGVLNTGLNKTLELGLYPFIPGDTLKLYLAAAALPGAWKLLDRVRDDAKKK